MDFTSPFDEYDNTAPTADEIQFEIESEGERRAQLDRDPAEHDLFVWDGPPPF